MKEEFLHYAWKYRRFVGRDLTTVDGKSIDILQPGRHNRDAGPDFLDARLRIDETVWAGNVEIHLAASDWHRHGHDKDPAYDNVILHVVFAHDSDIFNGNGQLIPALSLKDRIDYQTYRYYRSWLKSSGYIPCDPANRDVPTPIKTSAIQAAAVERIEAKSEVYLDHLNETRGDLDTAFYRVLLRGFGLKVNAMPFEQLARITPFHTVRKVRNNLPDLEALLLGQAGFLRDLRTEDAYIKSAIARYEFLAGMYKLHSMPKSSWKLFRLRPPNFPQVRLAQLARFIHRHESIARRAAELENVEDARRFFDVTLNDEFWLSHYTLEKTSPSVAKSIGSNVTDLLIINAVAPYQFALSRYNKDVSYRERAINLLESMPSEKNSVVRKFAEMGFVSKSAFDTQGVIQLKHFYCDERKCLSCKVGIHLLKDHGKN